MNFYNHIEQIRDFPKKGILYKDISPLIRDPFIWNDAINELSIFVNKNSPDLIAGIESRGFILGSALATKNKIGFVPIRKKGKLPGRTVSTEYSLEYGRDALEIQVDAITSGSRILIVDDLLATGGTVEAADKLIKMLNANVVGYCFIVELSTLSGRKKLCNKLPIKALVKY